MINTPSCIPLAHARRMLWGNGVNGVAIPRLRYSTNQRNIKLGEAGIKTLQIARPLSNTAL